MPFFWGKDATQMVMRLLSRCFKDSDRTSLEPDGHAFGDSDKTRLESDAHAFNF